MLVVVSDRNSNCLDWDLVCLGNGRRVALRGMLKVHDENPDVDPIVDQTGSAWSTVRWNLNVARHERVLRAFSRSLAGLTRHFNRLGMFVPVVAPASSISGGYSMCGTLRPARRRDFQHGIGAISRSVGNRSARPGAVTL